MRGARTRALCGLLCVAGLAGCFTQAPRNARSIPPPPSAPPSAPPAIPQAVPDAVPRVEPRSRYGNPTYYEVFGKRYYVLASSADYVERGVASWYGPGFHKERTSTLEPYDMYGMTAAHRTLPLPAYVRVTNLENGRSVVVRVNDRGPFVGNRIIDLSYTAAARLDMLRNGTAMVEVRSIDPTSPQGAGAVLATAASPATAPAARPSALAAVPVPLASAPAMTPAMSPAASAAAPPASPLQLTPMTPTLPAVAAGGAPPPATASAVSAQVPPSAAVASAAPVARTALFVQAGAFADPANAERLAAKLRLGPYGNIVVRHDVLAGRGMYRVRIGPVPGVPEFDRIVAALEQAGVHDAHLALD